MGFPGGFMQYRGFYCTTMLVLHCASSSMIHTFKRRLEGSRGLRLAQRSTRCHKLW